MRNIFAWVLIVFIAVCCCIVSYRYGFAVGQTSCPVKYAVCENGTCVLSETAPSAVVK
jgi:hypothetical protein